MKWLAVKAQFIRKSPVNWVLTGLCWGSGTHGLGIQELQCDACQTFELWQAGVAGMGRAAQPSAGTVRLCPSEIHGFYCLGQTNPSDWDAGLVFPSHPRLSITPLGLFSV